MRIEYLLSFFCLSILSLLLTSCGANKECCYQACHVCDFVIDSYQIRLGKLAICDLTGIELQEVPCDAMCEYEDVICENDHLSVAVYHPLRPDLMEAVKVINTEVGFRVYRGGIDLPDLPPVRIAGLTLDEAHRLLSSKYEEQVKGIEVFISYRERPSHKVELAGLVAIPSVPVNGKIRLYDVLSMARVPTQANLFMSYVSRGGCPLAIDLHQLLVAGDMSQNIVMRPGDKIYIADARDATVCMMGEVGLPKAVNLYYGFLSLREALVAAGGIPYTGDRGNIQVIRGGLLCPKIYVLDWCHITQLPNESLLLMPGDTVYVPETLITRWNRWISQLLPSMSCFQTGLGCYKVFMN